MIPQYDTPPIILKMQAKSAKAAILKAARFETDRMSRKSKRGTKITRRYKVYPEKSDQLIESRKITTETV